MLDYSLKRTSEPAAEPVSLTDLKAQLRIEGTDDDTLLMSLLPVGRQQVERDAGLSLISQSWTLKMDGWPSEQIVLYKPPVSSVTSIKYTDTAGATQTWTSTKYVVDTSSRPGLVRLAYGESWPDIRGDRRCIEVIYVAGYGAAGSSVPLELRQAVILATQMQYDGWCETVQAAYDRLINANRVGIYP